MAEAAKFTVPDFQQFFGVRHLYPLEVVDMKKSLYKYWSYSRIVELLDRKELTFVYPGLWNDPFEKRFLETDYTALGYQQPKIFCMCLTTSTDNEEAAWKIYASREDATIRCRMQTQILFRILDEYAEKNGCRVYISLIDYSLSKKEILTIDKREGRYDYYFGNFDESKYLSLMSLKRKAFRFENELRIFIVPSGAMVAEDILRVPVPLNLLEDLYQSFTIQPYIEIEDFSPRSRIRRIQQKIEKQVIKADLLDRCKGVKVYSSTLYNKCKVVDKVLKK